MCRWWIPQSQLLQKLRFVRESRCIIHSVAHSDNYRDKARLIGLKSALRAASRLTLCVVHMVVVVVVVVVVVCVVHMIVGKGGKCLSTEEHWVTLTVKRVMALPSKQYQSFRRENKKTIFNQQRLGPLYLASYMVSYEDATISRRGNCNLEGSL